MDEEIEDLVGDVQYTDSQKSVAASNVYSLDFTDSSSEKNTSSGQETYVIESYNSEESEPYPIKDDNSVICIKNYVRKPKNRDVDSQYENGDRTTRAASTSLQNCSLFSQEIFTQTSKTILELVQAEGLDLNNLETQTSRLTVTENKTLYTIKYTSSIKHFEAEAKTSETNTSKHFDSIADEESSRFPVSESDLIKSDGISEVSSDDKFIHIINDSQDDMTETLDQMNEEYSEIRYESSDLDDSHNSEMDDDSLMEPRKSHRSDLSDIPRSVDDDVEELYTRLSESIDIQVDRPYDQDRQLNTLTPLTEESANKKDSLQTISSNLASADDPDFVFNNSGVKIKMLPCGQDTFKLPPIQITNRPAGSPHLNFLFSLQSAKNLPGVCEDTVVPPDRWELGNNNLASGESALISELSQRKEVHLPPIHIEGYVVHRAVNDPDLPQPQTSPSATHDSISINDKIRELKCCNKIGRVRSRYTPTTESRSASPPIDLQPGAYDVTEKGCEALCIELIRRLRSSSWMEVADALDDIPKGMERFWGVIAEFRIADLIRQISAHVESPRTHVAKAACATLAAVLKNTKYTKKPDFYEAVTLLLTKTGSHCLPVRRAANVALDDVVCGVDLAHAATALCIHGSDHKSPLVRCAAARLLVVVCALAGGGRGLLRSRPPSAAQARAHVLRSLSVLLDDKNTDTRKYAERLFAMLRPLTNFEAYYLTDVDVEIASRQMKKHDRTVAKKSK